MGANGAPKDQSYVHGYPKPVSPVTRASHLHYGNEASGESFFQLLLHCVMLIRLVFCCCCCKAGAAAVLFEQLKVTSDLLLQGAGAKKLARMFQS